MVVLRLQDSNRYAGLAELRPAFGYLARLQEAMPGDGRHEIDGDRTYAIVVTHQPKPASECRFETHERYADVVCVAEGTEMIGYAPAETLAPAGTYDAEKDLAFYETPEFYTPVLLRAGMVAIFYPEDGHMPGAIYEHADQVRKAVVKVRVR